MKNTKGTIGSIKLHADFHLRQLFVKDYHQAGLYSYSRFLSDM